MNNRILEKANNAIITSCLDHCNSLYVGIDQSELNRLQLFQNAVDGLLAATKEQKHITQVLSSVHRLPIRYRIGFKILSYVFKSLNGLAPEYL